MQGPDTWGGRCESGRAPAAQSAEERQEQPTAGLPEEAHEGWRPAEGPVGLRKQKGWAVAPKSESRSLSPHTLRPLGSPAQPGSRTSSKSGDLACGALQAPVSPALRAIYQRDLLRSRVLFPRVPGDTGRARAYPLPHSAYTVKMSTCALRAAHK